MLTRRQRLYPRLYVRAKRLDLSGSHTQTRGQVPEASPQAQGRHKVIFNAAQTGCVCVCLYHTLSRLPTQGPRQEVRQAAEEVAGVRSYNSKRSSCLSVRSSLFILPSVGSCSPDLSPLLLVGQEAGMRHLAASADWFAMNAGISRGSPILEHRRLRPRGHASDFSRPTTSPRAAQRCGCCRERGLCTGGRRELTLFTESHRPLPPLKGAAARIAIGVVPHVVAAVEQLELLYRRIRPQPLSLSPSRPSARVRARFVFACPDCICAPRDGRESKC